MNKKLSYTLVTILLVTIYYFKTPLIENSIAIFNYTKKGIILYYQKIENYITSYFNQAEQIRELKKRVKEYEDYIYKVVPILENYQKLKLFKEIKHPNLKFTQTISYAQLPDMSAIYIDYYDKNLTTPQGLIYNNYSAGIVIKSIKNYSLAYLNNNPKVIYAVFIGKDKIPGILYGGNTIIIKYIPKYKKIEKGDIVITSGLDKIFYEGVKVGKIVSIKEKKLYQEATIKPFYNPLHPTFFYVVGK
jgi:rod shape-determining protein MreC